MSKDSRGGEPVAWQWLDTAHFRKKIPPHSNAAEWRPLFTSPQPAVPTLEQAIPYAGVTVWVGDKRCSRGVTKDELELTTFDILQTAFDHARRAVVRAAAEIGKDMK